MMTRRRLLSGTAIGVAAASTASGWVVGARGETFAVTHSEAEWRKLLTAEQFAVLRMSATERP
ncbi:MAG TPA: peptide-methionine (R)-S-oxide reductase, partial [Xanthobacteraceae bacterium]|nr:peptide-methionine (R)-S-oxide reductase [Xanthobacteraceae bacterium]HKD25157.1 peptide-methionine (R)-S-oxide reductase [Xanthobacteraceae bacterium]